MTFYSNSRVSELIVLDLVAHRCAWLDSRGGCPHTRFALYESLALFLIQIGVPTKPKAARI
jgi:hypothetical protein